MQKALLVKQFGETSSTMEDAYYFIKEAGWDAYVDSIPTRVSNGYKYFYKQTNLKETEQTVTLADALINPKVLETIGVMTYEAKAYVIEVLEAREFDFNEELSVYEIEYAINEYISKDFLGLIRLVKIK